LAGQLVFTVLSRWRNRARISDASAAVHVSTRRDVMLMLGRMMMPGTDEIPDFNP
jgi:hypothetical protein